TCQELATAVLEDLPIVVVIVNNGYLGMVQQWQNMFFDDRLSHVHLTHQVPDYALLAQAYGAAGFTVSSEDELEATLAEARPLDQIEKQMHKLVNVLRVAELVPGEAIERELALIKVTAPSARRGELLALAEVFHARVADLGPEALVFEVVGSPEEIDSFEELVRPHGVKELVRTGRIGLTRASDRSGIKRRQHVLR